MRMIIAGLIVGLSVGATASANTKKSVRVTQSGISAASDYGAGAVHYYGKVRFKGGRAETREAAAKLARVAIARGVNIRVKARFNGYFAKAYLGAVKNIYVTRQQTEASEAHVGEAMQRFNAVIKETFGD